MLGTGSCTLEIELANTYIYNTCVTLTVSVDPYLILVSKGYHFVPPVSDNNDHQKQEIYSIYWCLKNSDLVKVAKHLKHVCLPLEAGQPIQLENQVETINIKKGRN